MKNKKSIPYVPPEVEIITFDCDDIIFTSNFGDDGNMDEDW